jgi:lipase maturation factor 1
MFFPESYTISSVLFARSLGFIYFFAFGAFLFQIKGLIGQNGILPVKNFLEAVKRRYPDKYGFILPSVFWLNASDKALMAVTLAGTFLSVLLVCGFIPWLMLLLLYILYLSIISVGQDFLSFGWEGFLLEVTAHAFLLSFTTVPNLMVWISINVLVCRFHFQSGIVKFQSQDVNWRNFTALFYHYHTTPLPVALTWLMHKLPMGLQKFSCAAMFVIELILPIGVFGSENIRFAVFAAFFFLQFSIWISGNYSYLNHLTVVLCIILISNKFYPGFIEAPSVETPSLVLTAFLSLAGGVLLVLQLIRFWHHFVPSRLAYKILYPFTFFHLANRYGIFAIMTTNRYEIIVEGSYDGETWLEYCFWYKPSEVTRRPRRISPYHPRIDWQAWFLPFSDYASERWFQNFLMHLLKGSPEVLKLIRINPFPDRPPKYIKAAIFDYEWSSLKEKQQTGAWWRRTYVGNYSPIMMLRENK